jgi:hypothetical protein
MCMDVQVAIPAAPRGKAWAPAYHEFAYPAPPLLSCSRCGRSRPVGPARRVRHEEQPACCSAAPGITN